MVLVLTGACVITLASCASQRDRQPQRDGYVVQAYHYCDKCGTLQGGIYEKGPFKTLPGKNKAECVHQWHEIPRDRFTQLATELYDVDWSTEPVRF
jgi:hypothetical protein